MLHYANLRSFALPVLVRSLPYMELIRLHKPAGFLYIYLPYLYGSLFAFCIQRSIPRPSQVLRINIDLFLVGFIFRSIGCTWNDICDREFDRNSVRGRTRPIARGTISTSAATFFCFMQYVLLLAVLLSASQTGNIFYMVPVILTGHAYPYAKRFTNYAQLVLGVSLSCGMLIGCAFAGVDPLSLRTSRNGVAFCSLAGAYVLWTMIYDTIYAFQDIEDDKKMGLKALSVSYETRINALLSLLSIAQVALLALVGILLDASLLYYCGCFGTGLLLYCMVTYVDLQKPEACWWWFKWGSLLVGGSLAFSLGGELLFRIYQPST